MRTIVFASSVLIVAALSAACSGGSAGVDAVGAQAQVLTGPMDVTVSEPDLATFMVEVTGTPPLEVTWQRSADLMSWATVATSTVNPAPGSSTYTTGPTSSADDGAHIRVVVRGAADATGVPSSAATLTVLAIPTLTADVRDVAVPEGATAIFGATIAGGALAYQWEAAGPSGPFTVMAGEVGSSLTLPGVTSSMNGTRYRVTATNPRGSITSREARLTVFPAGSIATVYAQLGPAPALVEHPSLATASATGQTATADLAAGTFGGRADSVANPGTNRTAYAGLLRGLIFVNTTGAAVTIPAGGLRLVVAAAYTRGGAPARSSSSAFLQAYLAATINHTSSLTVSGGGSHQWAFGVDENGAPLGNNYSRFDLAGIMNGGTATASVFTYDALAMEVTLPALVVPAGAQLQINASVQTSASDFSAVDALTSPATLTMKLPAGVQLDRNTVAPLPWVTNLP